MINFYIQITETASHVEIENENDIYDVRIIVRSIGEVKKLINDLKNFLNEKGGKANLAEFKTEATVHHENVLSSHYYSVENWADKCCLIISRGKNDSIIFSYRNFSTQFKKFYHGLYLYIIKKAFNNIRTSNKEILYKEGKTESQLESTTQLLKIAKTRKIDSINITPSDQIEEGKLSLIELLPVT